MMAFNLKKVDVLGVPSSVRTSPPAQHGCMCMQYSYSISFLMHVHVTRTLSQKPDGSPQPANDVLSLLLMVTKALRYSNLIILITFTSCSSHSCSHL